MYQQQLEADISIATSQFEEDYDKHQRKTSYDVVGKRRGEPQNDEEE